MTKLQAKYAIADLLNGMPRGSWLTNEEILGLIPVSCTLKTVQNVTAGLKSNGGLRSRRDGTVLTYSRTSKKAVEKAQEFIF